MGNIFGREKRVKNFTNYKTYDELNKRLIESNVTNDYNMVIYIDCTKSNIHIDGTNNHDIPQSYPKISKHIISNPYLYVLDILSDFGDQGKLFFYGSSEGIIDGSGENEPFEELIESYVKRIKEMSTDDYTNIDNKKNIIADILKHSCQLVNTTKKYTIFIIVSDGHVKHTYILDIIKSLFSLSQHPASVIFICTNNKPDILTEIDDIHYEKLGLTKKEVSTLKEFRKFDNVHTVYIKDMVKRQLVSSNIRKKLFAEIFAEIPQQYKYIQQSNVLNYKPIPIKKTNSSHRIIRQKKTDMNESIMFVNMSSRKTPTPEILNMQDYKSLMEMVKRFDEQNK